jgi:hypothetical protein
MEPFPERDETAGGDSEVSSLDESLSSSAAIKGLRRVLKQAKSIALGVWNQGSKPPAGSPPPNAADIMRITGM